MEEVKKTENERGFSLYRGGFILLIGFLFVRFGGSLFKIILMNMLSVSAYGEFAVFMVLYNWFALFATLNVTIGLSKFVSQDRKRKELFYVSSLAGSLVLSLIVSGILFMLAPSLSSSLNAGQSIIYWAIVSIPFSAVYNISIFYLRGQYRMKSSVVADFIMTAVRLAALIGLLYAGLHFAPYISFLISFMLIDIYLVYRNRTGIKFSRRDITSTFRQMLMYSLPIFASEFLRLFSLGVDRLVLSGFYSTAEAGFYDVAVLLCIGYLVIANSYSNALLPLASGSEKDRKKRRSELAKALRASSLFFILYSVIILLAGSPVLSIINPAYLGIMVFLPSLAVAYIMIGFLTILTFFANAIGQQRYGLYAGCVFAFLSLSLNVYLIPSMMYWGAVTALLASSAVSLAVMAGFILRVER